MSSERRVRALSSLNRVLYRATGVLLGGRLGRIQILLLTTTGRKTGRRRTKPLLYLRDGERLALAASYGGRPYHPAWYLNLRAYPEAEVRIGRKRQRVRARDTTPEEREELWPRFVETYPKYALYQAKTSRRIPIVLLEPARAGGKEKGPREGGP